MKYKEARGVKFKGTEWNVRYLSKSNKIKWFSYEKMTPSEHIEIEDTNLVYDYDYESDSIEQHRLDALIRDTEELSDYNRGMLHLYYFKGMSLREISKATGIGINSVHNSIKYIGQTLKGADISRYKTKIINKSALSVLVKQNS
jgi:DNA-directed RNA polymerase specialized sigma subunit